MRGESVFRESPRLDTLLVAARYAPPDRRLTHVRAYERRGAVWTDALLLDRAALLHRLVAGKRVATALPRSLPGDFRVLHRVRREQGEGRGWIVAGEGRGGQDDLGLPLF